MTGAIAHLYRGEVYRSTIWRNALDNTTNWAIVDGHCAVDDASSPEASPLPLVLVGLLDRRISRYGGAALIAISMSGAPRAVGWRRISTRHMFTGEARDDSWQVILARDYTAPRHHILVCPRGGRRLRRNYVWILAVQVIRLLRQDSDPSDACIDPGRNLPISAARRT